MSEDFKVGDVVVCVAEPRHQSNPTSRKAAKTLKKGSIHKVESTLFDKNGNQGVNVSGANASPHPGFAAFLFRKLPPADPDFIKLIREVKPAKKLERV